MSTYKYKSPLLADEDTGNEHKKSDAGEDPSGLAMVLYRPAPESPTASGSDSSAPQGGPTVPFSAPLGQRPQQGYTPPRAPQQPSHYNGNNTCNRYNAGPQSSNDNSSSQGYVAQGPSITIAQPTFRLRRDPAAPHLAGQGKVTNTNSFGVKKTVRTIYHGNPNAAPSQQGPHVYANPIFEAPEGSNVENVGSFGVETENVTEYR
ncbi:hypothetical protein M413DRAFT_13373 [Hebeloma cylindrosporum]|uniref:Uncharacterized protein n=1 Tax=Hebeloma cylindrosporum TaxID=76867 RepID=A0A0C3BZG6_HEBCY|nr:hypothetical protein M413DRAFT_13373 [Hebeloma cylindrosporum h7]